NVELIGINIDKDETGQVSLDNHIVNLVKQTAELIDLETHFLKQELVLKSNYVGDGYGIVGQLEKEAISLTAQYEGILLDPVYTGRAMGGLIDMIRTGTIDQNDKVLFWHTGGTPALFAYSDDLISQQDTNEILQRTRR
ncbi:MAG: D-cysteine desulfhydrase family protein, partial [Thermodesulfobacteriota bacterium]